VDALSTKTLSSNTKTYVLIPGWGCSLVWMIIFVVSRLDFISMGMRLIIIQMLYFLSLWKGNYSHIARLFKLFDFMFLFRQQTIVLPWLDYLKVRALLQMMYAMVDWQTEFFLSPILRRRRMVQRVHEPIILQVINDSSIMNQWKTSGCYLYGDMVWFVYPSIFLAEAEPCLVPE